MDTAARCPASAGADQTRAPGVGTGSGGEIFDRRALSPSMRSSSSWSTYERYGSEDWSAIVYTAHQVARVGTVICAMRASVWSRSSVPASRSDASTRKDREPRRSRSSSPRRADSTASAMRSAANWRRRASSLE
ncbi:hypothetical protein SCALM49S_06090 [Streptomyces californicus]